jgi:thiamine-monophosphate kinase
LSLESYFIKQFKSKFIGDDGAVIDGNVYVQDAFFENIHFKREWFSLSEIAYKSVAVNVSDIYAMGAVPKYGLLTVAIPKGYSKSDLKELASGFHRAEKDFKFQIVGGDTISNSKLDISVTVIGKVRKPIQRVAKDREFIAYSGKVGEVGRDLKKLLKGGSIKRSSRFIKPVLTPDFIYKIAPLITAGMDISDGIYTDLSRIAKESRLSFHFYRDIPKSVGCSGEEYGFLFSFPKRNRKEIESIAKGLNVELTVIGEATKRGIYRDRCKPHHF